MCDTLTQLHNPQRRHVANIVVPPITTVHFASEGDMAALANDCNNNSNSPLVCAELHQMKLHLFAFECHERAFFNQKATWEILHDVSAATTTIITVIFSDTQKITLLRRKWMKKWKKLMRATHVLFKLDACGNANYCWKKKDNVQNNARAQWAARPISMMKKQPKSPMEFYFYFDE